MEKDIDFKKLYFRSFNQLDNFYNKMKIGTIVKREGKDYDTIGIFMGGNMQFALLAIVTNRNKTVKELVDNLLLNPDKKVTVEENATILLSPFICISEYRQEELSLWCMKKRLLLQ